MTVPANLNRVTYNGNGSTTVFAYTFPILDQDDLTVYLVNTTTDVATLQTITTHYTVSGVGELAGGNVTMVTAPASGYQLLIIREVSLTQESEYNDNRDIPADTIEDNFDKLTMIVQQHDETLDRSVTLPVQVSGVSAELPVPEGDTIIGWNTAATALENKTPGDLSSAFDITLSAPTDADKVVKVNATATGYELGDTLPSTSVSDAKKLLRINSAGTGYEVIAGTAYDQIFTMSSKIMKWAKGADVASASTVTLGDDGNFFDITGTTTITSITAKTAGTIVLLQFDGILTVTDGSNLKIAGNFVTAAESTMCLVSDGTNWYEISRSPVTSTKPAFHVHRNGVDQSIASATTTKVEFTHELFDTNSNFDSSTNYRFTPTVAGKYLFTLSIESSNHDTTSQKWLARINKNAGTVYDNWQTTNGSGAGDNRSVAVTTILDMNGTTDYVEAYTYQIGSGGTSKNIDGNDDYTFFTGCKID